MSDEQRLAGSMTEQERTLITGCLKGDKAAWDAFVQQYSNLVFHSIKKTFSLYHAVSDSALVEDLYQEFFVSILRDDCKKLRQFRGERGCTLASWVRLVAVRLAIDRLRKQKPPPTQFEDDFCEDLDPAEALMRRQEKALLAGAIQQLPPRDRLFVELCFHQSLQPRVVAGILQMSVNAVYAQKSRLLDKLREILEKSDSL